MKKLVFAGLAAALVAGAATAATGDRIGRIDADGNGAISAAELQSRQSVRFQRLDANKDGQLTQAEIQAKRAARAAKTGKPIRQGKAKRFARLDTDGNGALSLAEFTARAGKRITRLDLNKDGQVTREEMVQAKAARRAKRQG